VSAELTALPSPHDTPSAPRKTTPAHARVAAVPKDSGHDPLAGTRSAAWWAAVYQPAATMPATAATPRMTRRRGTKRTATVATPTASPASGVAMAAAARPVSGPTITATQTGARADS
jgi:hypothetical protein